VVLHAERTDEEEDAHAPSPYDYSEATLPGHLRGDEEGEAGYTAGEVLDGDGPIEAALAELKRPPAPSTQGAPSAGTTSTTEAADTAETRPDDQTR